MLLRAMLILFGVRFMLQEKLTLSPGFPDVLANSSLELICNVHIHTSNTQWGTFNRPDVFSYLTISKEETCITDGFLKDTKYFETKCYRNATFKVRIKQINISYHGQQWYCSNGREFSNTAYISVLVPIKYVNITNMSGDGIKAVENTITTLTCETSEGRPAANITWMKVSQTNITTDITNVVVNNVSKGEKILENKMIIVKSRIDIVPLREDNDTRIICQATNMERAVVRKEVIITVQYPPSKPIFVVADRIVNGSLRVISGNNVSVLCKSNSYPYQTYKWNSTRDSEYKGKYLNLSNITRNDTWQCTSNNTMTLPDKTKIFGRNFAKLKIYVLFPISKLVLSLGKENHTLNKTLYAIRNDDVTLLCSSNGDPTPRYQWIRHSPGAILHITSIQTNTNETCIASNEMCENIGEVKASSANKTVSIIVSYPPGIPSLEFSGHIKVTEVLENGTFLRKKVITEESSIFTVTCKADGFPLPSCKWNVLEGGSSPYLTFTNITKDAIGFYTCYAENIIKRSFPAYEEKNITSTELEIDVLYQSKIQKFDVTYSKGGDVFEVTENETIVFNCNVDSNPESEIVLLFKDTELRRDVSTQRLIYTHTVSSCLDGGLYKCTAKNKYNVKPSSKELEIYVRCTPLKSQEFNLVTNVSCAQNVSITFQFKAIAYPMPEYHWNKLNGSSWINLTSCNKYEIITGDTYSYLTVRQVTKDDYGHYKLKIQNKVGTLEQFYFIKPNEKPDPPKTFKHLGKFVTETSALLTWIPGFDGGPNQTFILRYKLALSSDWLNVSLRDTDDKTMNYTLYDLESGSVYCTELFAVNTEGKSMTLNLTFKTKDFPRLTENLVHDWMYVIYTSGGVIFIVVAFIVTTFTTRRLKQRSADTAIYRNVSFCAPETSNIYQNLQLSNSMAAEKDEHILPTREAAVNEPPEMIVEPQNNEISISRDPQELELDLEDQFSEGSEYINTLDIINRLEKIKVTELYDYVRCRTDESFSADFQKIPTGFQLSCSFSRRPENIAFNRNRGILPYDHTRVYNDDQPDFFINASYIDGYKEPKAYIACLGPTAKTHDNFKTFWKMVWHEKSELIVMVTNLNELSGMKCEQYWPDLSQDEMYGDILVSCQKIEMFAEYTIRCFEVTRTTNAENLCRRLVHLHYTAWPDKRTPEDVTSYLEFRQAFHDIRTTVHGPVIIHGSAGIGRTGVFIAIDKLIMEGKNEGSVNVVACITKMREQRMKMVQTIEQYKFIFQALAYALNFDCGPVLIGSLTEHNKMSDVKIFDRQYKELRLSLEEESKEQIYSRAKNKSFKDKNRQGADIPDNTNQVNLHLNRSFEESDYINAVYINSYKCKDHFIMAQSPLSGTESDFLTMIYQENCFCVVSMEDCNENGVKIGKYLLTERQSLDICGFTVSCFINDSKPQYTIRNVTIKNKEFLTDERDFYHFQYNTWTARNDIPQSAEEFVEFVKDVQEYAILGYENSHVLVHCLKANERSGLFCATAIIREKLLFDEQVSVMNTLRHLRTRRPSAITSVEQLKFCYQAAIVIANRQNEGLYVNNSVMI